MSRARKGGILTRRKVLATGAAVAAGAGAVFAACPHILRARASEPLKFWQFYGPGGDHAGQSKWFEDMVKSWNESHDIKVALEYIPNNEYMGGTKLPTAFVSGHGPDIFLISPGDFLRYYNGGVLLDLTPFLEERARSDFPEAILGNRMVDGKIYGIPMEVEPMAMYYSVAAFEEAGISEVPKTWDELLVTAKKLTNEKRFGVLFETTPGYYQNFTWYPFLWEGGGEFQTAEGKSAFNSPAVIQALKFWQDAIKMGVAPRKPLGGGGWDAVPNLGSGYCAMQNVGVWAISRFREAAPDFKYGIFRLPTPPGGKYFTVGGGWAFVANSRGRNPEAAAQFCAWAVGSMTSDSIGRVVDWCTKAKSDMSPRRSAFEQGKLAFEDGSLKVFTDEIHPGTRAEPRVPPQVYKIISDAIQACQLNEQDPAETAAAASEQLDAFLARYRGAPIL
jgi:multiple sugar transport system substrate-binding protein